MLGREHQTLSQVRSWSIHTYPVFVTGRDDYQTERLSGVQEAEEVEEETLAAGTSSMVYGARIRDVRTTGLFDVPGEPGDIVRLEVAVSSFATARQEVAVQLNKAVGNELVPVFFRSFAVPEGEARRLELEIGDLIGETVEVAISSGSDDLKPSAAVTQFFPADGGILVLLYKSPADFVEV